VSPMSIRRWATPKPICRDLIAEYGILRRLAPTYDAMTEHQQVRSGPGELHVAADITTDQTVDKDVAQMRRLMASHDHVASARLGGPAVGGLTARARRHTAPVASPRRRRHA
jgi:hypothetical protein